MGKKLVFSTVLLLVLVIGVFAFLNRSDKGTEPETIKITKNGQLVQELSMEEIKLLPPLEKEVTLNSTLGREAHRFTGTLVKEIFQRVDPNLLDQAEQVVSKAVDGYTVAFSIKEVLEGENVLLVYAQDGKPLGSKEDGGTGPFRIIVPNDQFAQRAGKYVGELEVR